jgi:hypothetical protein
MIERREAAPLRLSGTSTSAGPAPSAGSVLALPSGEIAGDFRPVAGRERRRSATYELLVANDTALPVATFVYAAVTPQAHGPLTWNAIVVPPFSAIALEIVLARPRGGGSIRGTAELHAGEAKLSLDAGQPGTPHRSWKRRAAATLAAGAALLGVAGFAIAQAQPRVLALALPNAVIGGTPFDVVYALGGASEGDFDVETPGGMQLERGHLTGSSGAFTLDLPASTVSNGYDVRVVTHGNFGSDSRTAHVVALAVAPAAPVARAMALPAVPRATPAAASVARVGALTLARDEVSGGQPIVVNYRTAAVTGSVRLIDQVGTVRAEALLNRGGRSIVVAPYTDVDQDFRIVVSTELGAARGEAAVPVRVLGTSPPTMVTTTGDGSAADGSSPIALDAVTDAATGVVVQILRHEPALHVSLVDATGAELAARDIPPNATSVTLPVPAGHANAQLSVIASFAKGFAQETVIRAVTLRAGSRTQSR